jgi:hypothetical protein
MTAPFCQRTRRMVAAICGKYANSKTWQERWLGPARIRVTSPVPGPSSTRNPHSRNNFTDFSTESFSNSNLTGNPPYSLASALPSWPAPGWPSRHGERPPPPIPDGTCFPDEQGHLQVSGFLLGGRSFCKAHRRDVADSLSLTAVSSPGPEDSRVTHPVNEGILINSRSKLISPGY